MSADSTERVRELLKRAGLGAVPPAAFAGIAAIAVVVLVAGIWRWSSTGGESFDVETAGQTAVAQEMAAIPAESVEATCVVVHVVGAVRHPGIVSVDAGSRVSDALDAAGGLLPNSAQEALNLARVVADGEQVVVPTIDEWQAGGAAGAGGLAAGAAGAGVAGAGVAVVNLNTATASELETLPGVGPSTAAKIIADREANGLFTAPEDLMRVSGIGEKKFEALKDAVVVR